MTEHRVVSHEEWIAARTRLLAKEKALTRERDRLLEELRALPWEKVEKTYTFDGPDGQESLSDLFAGKSQLIVYHFMFGPGWKAGCEGCSFGADHFDAALVHLAHRDVSFVSVSRAPLAAIEAYRRRMGWKFKWVSSHDSDFNFDFGVSLTPEQIAKGRAVYNYREQEIHGEEMAGTSVFAKDGSGQVFHTYSTFNRGDEGILGTYVLLDMTPKGRDETGPRFDLSDWVRRHDEYGDAPRTRS